MQRNPRQWLGCILGISGAGSLIRTVRFMWIAPKEWLKQRVDPTNPLAIARAEFEQFDETPPGAQGGWTRFWNTFIGDMLPGDEVWSFDNAKWDEHAGWRGYCIVRAGQPLKSIVTVRNDL